MTVTERDPRKEYEEFASLFEELADDSTPEARRQRVRDDLVTGHLPLAEHIARRFRNRGQPEDDLAQVATVGLINAVDRYDPGRGTDFVAFAVPTITGEVRRYFRDSTWAMRVPRRLKELHTSINAVAAKLGQELGRSPRPSELAAALDVTLAEVQEGLQAGYAYRNESLDETDDDNPGRTSMIDRDLLTVENREALHPVLSKLPEREAAIVVMRFYGEMTQSQIAERMGLSQMHVSRLLSSSLAVLRAALADRPE